MGKLSGNDGHEASDPAGDGRGGARSESDSGSGSPGHVAPETLGAWVEGRLDEAHARVVEAHIAACADCLAAVAAVGAAGELARFAAPLAPTQVERLERLGAPARAPGPRRRRTGSGRRPAVASPWASIAHPARASIAHPARASTLKLLVPLAAAIVVGLLLLAHTRIEDRSTNPVALHPESSPAASPTARPTPPVRSTPAPDASPSSVPFVAPSAEPTPGASTTPGSPEVTSPSPEPGVSPRPEVSPAPDPGTSPAPGVSPGPGASPGPTTPPGTETGARPELAADLSPLDVELAAGSCTLAKKPLRAGERTRVSPGQELVASSGSRLRVRGSELFLKGSVTLDERRAGKDPVVTARLRSGELLLAVAPAGESGAAPPAFELTAGNLRGRPQPGSAARVLCSLAPSSAQISALEGAVRLGDSDGELALDLTPGQQVVSRKGARVASLKAEAARAPGSWTSALAAREALVSRSTFETGADGWDEEERAQPGFGGSAFGLRAVPTGGGQPWRFLALRTRGDLDPATAAIRFRFRTPLPNEPLLITVYRQGAQEKLVATVRPPVTRDTWALFDLRLSAFAHEAGAGDGVGLGADRKAKIVVQQGTDHDPVPADFVIDDFEILERAN